MKDNILFNYLLYIFIYSVKAKAILSAGATIPAFRASVNIYANSYNNATIKAIKLRPRSYIYKAIYITLYIQVLEAFRS